MPDDGRAEVEERNSILDVYKSSAEWRMRSRHLYTISTLPILRFHYIWKQEKKLSIQSYII